MSFSRIGEAAWKTPFACSGNTRKRRNPFYPFLSAVEEEEPATPATALAAPATKAPKANLAKAFATAAGGKKRGAPVKRGGAALLNAFPATKKARAGA